MAFTGAASGASFKRGKSRRGWEAGGEVYASAFCLAHRRRKPRRLSRPLPSRSDAEGSGTWEPTLLTQEAVCKSKVAPMGMPLPPVQLKVTGKAIKLAAALVPLGS